MKQSFNHTDTVEIYHSADVMNITFNNYLHAEKEADVATEIFSGLSAEQKTISSRFFYDQRGSQLFEEISLLPEYYPTRTEKSILKRLSQDIIAQHENPDIVELGSGDCSKICILLDSFQESQLEGIRYFPVDISEAAILKSSRELGMKYPGLRVHGILADFMKHLEALPGEGNSIICFFGSTLGNLENDQALEFVRHVKRSMSKGDSFLIGLDMVKDKDTLELAYNDDRGITEAFNKNILTVVNRLAGTNFIAENFKHLAFFNSERSRIEMHLKSLKNQTIESHRFKEKIFVKKGETIHTENSRKFTHEDIQELANVSGLSIQGIHIDQGKWFSLVHFIYSG
ncbi:MAG: L-histidine N(alpha)-methyltransferase [Bacteroidales bacterium]|nr:L-histidine N(alpha)-methyltransferase [Bacteroidales bacterium]